MAIQAIKQHINSVHIVPNTLKSIYSILKFTQRSVIKKLHDGSFLIPKKPSNLQALIEKSLQKLNPVDIESNIRKAKLREAERLKQELKGKLENVSKTISTLQTTEEAHTFRKPNLMDRETRKEYYENEKKKTEEVAQNLLKFTEQQKIFQNALNLQIAKVERQELKQKQLEALHAEYMIHLRDERIKEERWKMIERKAKRKKEVEALKKIKSESNLHLNTKPLFQKFEEKFKTDIEMPELERRKEELKRKRLLYSPIPKEAFKEHSEWYSSVKESHKKHYEKEQKEKAIEQKMREASLLGSFWNVKAIEEERIKREEFNNKLKEKVQMIEKRNNYADLVQEMYSPVLDNKPHEHKRNDKSEDKVKIAKNKKKQAKSDGENKEESQPWKPSVFKPNSMVPTPKKQKEPKMVDYLLERRRLREEKKDASSENQKVDKLLQSEMSSSFSPKDLEGAKKRAMKLEELARKKSLLIQNTPDSIIAMKETQNVDNLLIGSIKAKLMILNKLE